MRQSIAFASLLLAFLACESTTQPGADPPGQSSQACSDAGTRHSIVSGNEQWLRAGNPHHVTATIVVASTLTLEPGVVVCFAPGTQLNIGGTPLQDTGELVAVGTAEQPIIFTAKDFTQAWGGIRTDEYAHGKAQIS